MSMIKSFFSHKLVRQFISFVFVSGIGWLIDFSIYVFLTSYLDFAVTPANLISTIPAITWVFWASVRRIFEANKTGLKIYQKCIIYFAYHLTVIICFSLFAGYLYTVFMSSELVSYAFLYNHIKIIIKIIITPVTMTLNFIATKLLIEKL